MWFIVRLWFTKIQTQPKPQTAILKPQPNSTRKKTVWVAVWCGPDRTLNSPIRYRFLYPWLKHSLNKILRINS